MEKAKHFFDRTKFLWIGGVMGICQQLLGELHQDFSLLDFTQIMGGIEFYATIIMLVIFREKPPKEQLKDIFLFFLGLDFFYYFYIFITDIFWFFIYNNEHPDNKREISYFFQDSSAEIYDFIWWTALGTAGAFWAFFATKFRNNNKKKLYIIMLLPLVLVLFQEFIYSIIMMFLYLTQEYKRANGLPLPENICYNSTLVSILTDIACIIVSLKVLIKRKKSCNA